MLPELIILTVDKVIRACAQIPSVSDWDFFISIVGDKLDVPLSHWKPAHRFPMRRADNRVRRDIRSAAIAVTADRENCVGLLAAV